MNLSLTRRTQGRFLSSQGIYRRQAEQGFSKQNTTAQQQKNGKSPSAVLVPPGVVPDIAPATCLSGRPQRT